MERTHKKGFALWTVPNLFLIFNLLPVPTVPLVFCSLILFASVPKFRVSLQQLQPPFKIDALHSYPTRWITRCYLNETADSFRFLFLCLFLTLQPPVGHGLFIHEVSRSHTTTHHSR